MGLWSLLCCDPPNALLPTAAFCDMLALVTAAPVDMGAHFCVCSFPNWVSFFDTGCAEELVIPRETLRCRLRVVVPSRAHCLSPSLFSLPLLWKQSDEPDGPRRVVYKLCHKSVFLSLFPSPMLWGRICLRASRMSHSPYQRMMGMISHILSLTLTVRAGS